MSEPEESPNRYTITCPRCGRFGAVVEFIFGPVPMIVWEADGMTLGATRDAIDDGAVPCPSCAREQATKAPRALQ